MDDFYSVLGVPPNASIAQIKQRYRFLAQAYHPDKFASDSHKRDAEEAFKGINEAFQTLSDPSLRADYDRQSMSDSTSPPKSKTTPPPPRPEPPPPRAARKSKPTQPRSRRLLPLSSRTIVFLMTAAGIGIVLVNWPSAPTPPASPSYEERVSQKTADVSGYEEITRATSTGEQPQANPTPEQPNAPPKTAFDLDAYLASKASPAAESHGEEAKRQQRSAQSPSPTELPPYADVAAKAGVEFESIKVLAEKGDPFAQDELGWRYRDGYGVAKDAEEAVKWFRKAAEQGDSLAQYDIGSSYERGEGVPRDYVEAYKWMRLAAFQGIKKAAKELPGVVRQLSPAEIKEGQRWVREFRPRKAP